MPTVEGAMGLVFGVNKLMIQHKTKQWVEWK